MSSEVNVVTLDLREMPPRERHPRIFSTFEGLEEGQILRIINDHDPKPLYYQLSAEREGEFEWAYRVRGPTKWKVDITRLGDTKEDETLKGRVDKALQSIRPHLNADGGDVKLIDVSEEGVVSVKLVGACHECPGATMTLQTGIQRLLETRVPEVKNVQAV